MESEILKICACALLCGIACAVLGKASGGMSVGIRIAGLALVFGGIVGLIGTVLELIGDLGIDGGAAVYTSIMLRGLGIAVLCRLCSDICRDCGEASIALAVESAGKLASVILAMPAVSEIIEVARTLSEKI